MELWALGERVAPVAATAPVVVSADRLAVAGDWLLVDATQNDVAVTVPESDPGEELRVRRWDASSNQALLLGAFTAQLGPGHALHLIGEAGGAWGAW